MKAKMTLSMLSLPGQTNALNQTKIEGNLCDWKRWFARVVIAFRKAENNKAIHCTYNDPNEPSHVFGSSEDCVVRITTISRLTNAEFDQKRSSIRANLRSDSSRTAISKRLRSRTRLTMLRRDSCHRRFIHIFCSQKRALSLTSPRRYLGAMSISCCGEN